jgi:hypothetical protein
VLRGGESLEVESVGGAPVRLEWRPILESSSDTANVVLATTLNDVPYRYEAKRSAHDPDIQLPNDPHLEGLSLLGKRDRAKYVLPEEAQRLRIHYMAGDARAVLIRVRQPE